MSLRAETKCSQWFSKRLADQARMISSAKTVLHLASYPDHPKKAGGGKDHLDPEWVLMSDSVGRRVYGQISTDWNRPVLP
jgi:hypothetical protein